MDEKIDIKEAAAQSESLTTEKQDLNKIQDSNNNSGNSNNNSNNNNNDTNNKNKNKQNQNQNQNQNKQNQLVNKGFSDTYKRINFLYQASNLMLNTTNNQPISSFYSKTLKRIAQKQVIHVNPSIKRTLCKKCSSLLVPGHTSTVRVQNSRETHTVVTCNNCKKVKRFNSNKKKNRHATSYQEQSQSQPI